MLTSVPAMPHTVVLKQLPHTYTLHCAALVADLCQGSEEACDATDCQSAGTCEPATGACQNYQLLFGDCTLQDGTTGTCRLGRCVVRTPGEVKSSVVTAVQLLMSMHAQLGPPKLHKVC